MTAFEFCAALLEMIGERLISEGERRENKATQRVGTLLTAVSFAALAVLAVALHRLR